jgi:hypothetical protein
MLASVVLRGVPMTCGNLLPLPACSVERRRGLAGNGNGAIIPFFTRKMDRAFEQNEIPSFL